MAARSPTFHVPDTNIGGYQNFNRFYFGQVGKQAAIIDERYNHGGQIADSIIDELERPPAKLRYNARRREVLLAHGPNLWSQDDDHQRNVGLRRRLRYLGMFKQGQGWAAGWHRARVAG